MAKVLDAIDRGRESAHLILSPSVRPCPLALADRDRRAKLEPRDLTAWFFGDPLPGACQRSIGQHAMNEPLRLNIEIAGRKRTSVAVAGTDVGEASEER